MKNISGTLSKREKYFFACFLVSAISLFSACRKSETFIDQTRRFEALEQGSEFTMKTVEDEIEKLIVNFYAPDCPPCEKEMPALKKIYDKYHLNKSIGFIAVGSSLRAVAQNVKSGTDPPVKREEIKTELLSFSKKFSPAWPQYIADAQDLVTWRITGFPETFIFTRKKGGVWSLQRKYISQVDTEILESEINGSGQTQ